MEYSTALTLPDMVMQVYCKKYLLSSIRFVVDIFLTQKYLKEVVPSYKLQSNAPKFLVCFMVMHFLK